MAHHTSASRPMFQPSRASAMSSCASRSRSTSGKSPAASGYCTRVKRRARRCWADLAVNHALQRLQHLIGEFLQCREPHFLHACATDAMRPGRQGLAAARTSGRVDMLDLAVVCDDPVAKLLAQLPLEDLQRLHVQGIGVDKEMLVLGAVSTTSCRPQVRTSAGMSGMNDWSRMKKSAFGFLQRSAPWMISMWVMDTLGTQLYSAATLGGTSLSAGTQPYRWLSMFTKNGMPFSS